MGSSKGIMSSIMKSYILFILSLLLLIFCGLITFAIFSLRGLVETGVYLTPRDIVGEDLENIAIDQIEELGGWIEVLDADLNVIYSRGNKQDNIMTYSYDDIIRSGVSVYGNDTFKITDLEDTREFIILAEPFVAGKGEENILLVKYPKKSVNLVLSLSKLPRDFNVGEAKYVVFVFLILLLLNIYLFGRWNHKKINRSLIEITKGIEEMENQYIQLDFEAEKEFMVIRDAFNKLNDNLRESELEKERLQAARNNLLMDLSHDIKTPITTIQNFSKALADNLIGEEDRDRYYDTIYEKSVRVNDLIDDLFTFVKLENSDYKLNLTQQDFVEFLRKIISYHYNEIEEKGIILQVNLPEEEIILEFDEKLIDRALSNVIVNGIKHNPKGTKLNISLWQDGRKIVLQIKDNGAEIPKGIRRSIFDTFVTGDQSRSSKSGSGLGLSICKNILARHNWNISLINAATEEYKTIFNIEIDRP